MAFHIFQVQCDDNVFITIKQNIVVMALSLWHVYGQDNMPSIYHGHFFFKGLLKYTPYHTREGEVGDVVRDRNVWLRFYHRNLRAVHYRDIYGRDISRVYSIMMFHMIFALLTSCKADAHKLETRC